jgi:hypothetical protein
VNPPSSISDHRRCWGRQHKTGRLARQSCMKSISCSAAAAHPMAARSGPTAASIGQQIIVDRFLGSRQCRVKVPLQPERWMESHAQGRLVPESEPSGPDQRGGARRHDAGERIGRPSGPTPRSPLVTRQKRSTSSGEAATTTSWSGAALASGGRSCGSTWLCQRLWHRRNGQRHEVLSVRFHEPLSRCASGMFAGVVFGPVLRVIFVLDSLRQPLA